MADVTITGAAEVARAAEHAAKALAEYVADEARRVAPVGSAYERDDHPGELRRSITVDEASGEVSVVARASYAAFVEFGTSRMRAEPFLTPALQRGLANVREIAGAAFGEEVR